MSQFISDQTNALTFTQLLGLGNANSTGSANVDLQGYKGPVTVMLAVSQSTIGVGTIDNCNVVDSADGTTYTAVTGGAFTAVTNTANASNVGIQTKTFNTRSLQRYLRCTLNVSGTNANIPLAVVAMGQKERV